MTKKWLLIPSFILSVLLYNTAFAVGKVDVNQCNATYSEGTGELSIPCLNIETSDALLSHSATLLKNDNGQLDVVSVLETVEVDTECTATYQVETGLLSIPCLQNEGDDTIYSASFSKVNGSMSFEKIESTSSQRQTRSSSCPYSYSYNRSPNKGDFTEYGYANPLPNFVGIQQWDALAAPNYSKHLGVDYMTPAGTAVYSICDGTVTGDTQDFTYQKLSRGRSNKDAYFNSRVIVNCDKGSHKFLTIYGHVDKALSAGTGVTKGQKIAQIAPAYNKYNNRWEANDHLHFGLRSGYSNPYWTGWGIAPYPISLSDAQAKGYQDPLNYLCKNPAKTYQLKLASKISISPNPIEQHTPVRVEFSIKNTGQMSFSGQIATALNNTDGSFRGDIGNPQATFISAGQTKSFSFYKSTISSSPKTYQLQVKFLSTNGGWLTVPKGSYTNPMSIKVVSGSTQAHPGTTNKITATQGIYSTKIFVDWDRVSGANEYKLYRNTRSSRSSAKLVKTTSYSYYYDHNVTAGNNYYYWVKAVNSSGSSDYSAYARGYAKQTSSNTSPSNLEYDWSGNASLISYHGLNRNLGINETKPFAIYRDQTKLHPSLDNPIAFFQWQADSRNCKQLKVYAGDNQRIQTNITIGRWNDRDSDEIFSNVTLPFVIGENNTSDIHINSGASNWFVLSVAPTSKVASTTNLFAECTTDYAANYPYAVKLNKPIMLKGGYRWNGAASVISHNFRNHFFDKSQTNQWSYGAFKDMTVVTPSGDKPVVFFQWQISPQCQSIEFIAQDKNGNAQNVGTSLIMKSWGNAQPHNQMSIAFPFTVNYREAGLSSDYGSWAVIQLAFKQPVSKTTNIYANCTNY